MLPRDLVGQVLLGKLRVVRCIGEGATSVVYEVEHLLTKHHRALKVLRPELSRSGEAVARLVREAGAAGKIRSPFVAETFDVGRLPDGSTYVLSELLGGETLRAVLDREARLPPRRAVELLMQLCEGLAAVHAAGIVHRDIKPENVIVEDRGAGPGALRIVDFGAMGLPAGPDTLGKLTGAGAIAGTPRYMAPEQIEAADVDARADLYAAGVVLFEALAGGRPFEEDSAAALVRAILSGEAPRLPEVAPDVDADLAAIVERAMARDRDARFASANDLQRALGEWAARHPEGASPFPTSSALARKYDVVRCLKSGGMGAVYEVLHRDTHRRCALKVMLPALLADDRARERFAREARAAAAIASEHIVEVLDAGVDPESRTPYLVMELLRGEELGSLVARRRALSSDEVIALVAQAAGALDKAHAAGVIHRDLKPENLFVTSRDDGTPKVKILDFGIAKLAGEAAGAATGAALGTPTYMAPEQLEAGLPVGPRADLYALAHVAFTLLAGATYWSDEARAGLLPLFAKVLAGAREPATARAARHGVTLPEAFDAWFAKATAVDPAQRFTSAAEQSRALADALGSARTGDIDPEKPATKAQSLAPSSSVPDLVATRERRDDASLPPARPLRTAAFVAAAAVLVVAGVLAGRAGRPTDDAAQSAASAGSPSHEPSSSPSVIAIESPSQRPSSPAIDAPPASAPISSSPSIPGLPSSSAKAPHPAATAVPRASASAPAPTPTRTRDSVF